MVFEIIDDALETMQNALLVFSGWFLDAVFPTSGVSGELTLWVVVALMAFIVFL